MPSNRQPTVIPNKLMLVRAAVSCLLRIDAKGALHSLYNRDLFVLPSLYELIHILYKSLASKRKNNTDFKGKGK